MVYVSLILLLLKSKTAAEINPSDPYLRALSMSLEGCLTTERSLGGVMKSILNLCVGDSTRVMDDKEKKSYVTHGSIHCNCFLQAAELGFPLLGTERMGRSR